MDHQMDMAWNCLSTILMRVLFPPSLASLKGSLRGVRSAKRGFCVEERNQNGRTTYIAWLTESGRGGEGHSLFAFSLLDMFVYTYIYYT